MTTLIELCGIARGGAILAAVRQIVSEARKPTPAAVDELCQRLPGWDPADQEEVDAAMAMLDAQADAHVRALNKEAEQSPVENPEQPPAETAVAGSPAMAVPVSREEALEALRVARLNVGTCRAALATAQNRHQSTRAALSAAIQRYQTQMPRVTHEAAAKAVADTARLVRAQGGARQPAPVLQSRIDQERYYARRGQDANDFARSRMARGARRFKAGDRMLPNGTIVRGG